MITEKRRELIISFSFSFFFLAADEGGMHDIASRVLTKLVNISREVEGKGQWGRSGAAPFIHSRAARAGRVIISKFCRVGQVSQADIRASAEKFRQLRHRPGRLKFSTILPAVIRRSRSLEGDTMHGCDPARGRSRVNGVPF